MKVSSEGPGANLKMTSVRSWRATVPAVLMLIGCGGNPDGEPTLDRPPLERLKSVDRDLTIGSTGDDVRALHEHLAAIGYLPNEAIANAQPGWEPVVAEAPADASVFDERTGEAVRRLQIDSGIAPSGVLDKQTLAALTGLRCGTKDRRSDSEVTIAYSPTWGSRWPSNTITWRITGSDDVTPAQARTAAINALAQWSGTTSITFVETTGTPNIDIMFDASCGGFLACVPNQPPAGGAGGDIHVSLWPNWTPIGLQSTLTHELGHALSLDHSSFPASMMWPGAQGFVSLGIDDQFAISTLYDAFSGMPDQATDIAASLVDLQTWKVGTIGTTGGFQIYHWESDHWELASGNRGGRRIAVAAGGRPWMVDSAGAIYRRTTASTFSGTWELMPGAAKDIGAGSDGSIWVVGTNPAINGFGLHKWNGSGWDGATGTHGATRIAVDSMGNPWIVNALGSVYRRTSNSPFSGSWEQLPTPTGGATDIAIYGRLPSSSGAFNGGYAYVTAGPSLMAWNEQEALGGNNPAPGHRLWRTVTSFGVAAAAVAATSTGSPYVVLNNGSTYRTLR